ncbi:MAG: sodium:solute symporter family transporter [Thermoguttaceae bacterium]
MSLLPSLFAAFELKMPQMQTLDWVVFASVLSICFLPALYFGRRSGKSTAEFFASGRSVPWWLIGISMVATTFASDTPNLVTDIVRKNGVAGNWVWWAFTLTGVATVFFYARLWRRSGVMTDLEFYQIRYSGESAKLVRGFRAIYLGFFFNCIIMGNVNLAACKIANITFGFSTWKTLVLVGILDIVFAMYAGLWGAMVIDMLQFGVMMTGVIAMAYFAVNNDIVGGLSNMLEKVGAMSADGGVNYLNMFPSFTDNWELAIAIFIIPITIQWWSVWYPGAEPGGGSYIAQRMLASRSEKDALGGTLFFNVAHYVLRPWPWILTALASLIVFPNLASLQTAFPHLSDKLLGDDIAYPAMMTFLPVGFFGLMIAALVSANSSTILTHLNWGASYCVHDFYRIFLVPGKSEKHYVLVGRLTTLLIFLVSCSLVFFLESAKAGFDILLQVGAGTGLLYLVRWFWWRINAWCEVVAMVFSFVISAVFVIGDNMTWWCSSPQRAAELMEKFGREVFVLNSHERLILTVAVTTVAWIIAAYFGPKTDMATLVEFYKKVKPAGWGWEPVRKAAGLTREEVQSTGDNIPIALLSWSCGCAMIWSSLFLVGNILYGRTGYAVICGVIFVVTATVVVRSVQRLWK